MRIDTASTKSQQAKSRTKERVLVLLPRSPALPRRCGTKTAALRRSRGRRPSLQCATSFLDKSDIKCSASSDISNGVKNRNQKAFILGETIGEQRGEEETLPGRSVRPVLLLSDHNKTPLHWPGRPRAFPRAHTPVGWK